MTTPWIDPAWRLHAAGFQTAAAPVAVLGSSVNVVGIERTGVGRYTITLDSPADPLDTIDQCWTVGTSVGTASFDVDAGPTDTTRFVRTFNLVAAPGDGLFRFMIFRSRVPA